MGELMGGEHMRAWFQLPAKVPRSGVGMSICLVSISGLRLSSVMLAGCTAHALG